jgi:hypothetical protein
VEIRYLYAFKGGSLFQPFLIGVREDVEPNECTVTQCFFKVDDELA